MYRLTKKGERAIGKLELKAVEALRLGLPPGGGILGILYDIEEEGEYNGKEHELFKALLDFGHIEKVDED